jgi:homoserine kinase
VIAAPSRPDIVVPGSISNLGPSFDALSVAIRLYLRLHVSEVIPSRPDTIEWTFVGQEPTGENRIDSAFKLARAKFGSATPGLRVEVRSEIPQTAGLGSSAAAAVAGLRLYESFTEQRPDAEWLPLASKLEGHPDNAAAALLGGLAVSCQQESGEVIARSSRWPEDVHFVVGTPDSGLHTSLARRVLPTEVTLGDAVFNLQRSLLFVSALQSGRYEDLRIATHDRWHQPARAPLVPGLTQAMEFQDPAVLGVCLSGAGPSIVVFATTGTRRAAALLDDLYTRLGLPCTIRTLSAHQPDEKKPRDSRLATND